MQILCYRCMDEGCKWDQKNYRVKSLYYIQGPFVILYLKLKNYKHTITFFYLFFFFMISSHSSIISSFFIFSLFIGYSPLSTQSTPEWDRHLSRLFKDEAVYTIFYGLAKIIHKLFK